MREELNSIIVNESEALSELISLLEQQSKLALEDNIIGLDGIVSKIDICNKKIAELEMKRRAITNGEDMSKIVAQCQDKELEQNYRKIKLLIQEAIVQKDFNMDFIKQGLNFTNKILSIINPDRIVKTYNSYGKMKR